MESNLSYIQKAPQKIMGLRVIDIAVNLTDPMFQGLYRGRQKHAADVLEVLERAKQAGVEKILITGTSVADSRHALDQSRQLDPGGEFLYTTIGCHPTNASEVTAESIEELSRLIETNRDRVVAVGECGLDYDRTGYCDVKTQKIGFEMQFKLAEKHGLPMFLHSRNTAGTMNEMLKKHRSRFITGVVHSFTGTIQEAREIIEMDLYIGINGCSLKTAEGIEVVRSLPIDRIMLETDAPWCSIRPSHASAAYLPSLKRSERNEPCKIIEVLTAVANIKQQTIDLIAAATRENTKKVFNI